MDFLTVYKKITSDYRLPVTAGFGPRYLHSSGQLHKGDSGKGLFIQLTSEIKNDINIPDGPLSEHSSITFGILKNAQALGDYGALKDAGRNIISIDIGSDVDTGLNKLLDIF